MSVVSDVPGTTTDPVYKTMKLLPVGPVVIIDTAGIDDVGDLGNLRMEKTYDVLRKTNFAVLVINADEGLTEFDESFAKQLKTREIPAVCVINKCDLKAVANTNQLRHADCLYAGNIKMCAGSFSGSFNDS